jgi:hypothetical protein
VAPSRLIRDTNKPGLALTDISTSANAGVTTRRNFQVSSCSDSLTHRIKETMEGRWADLAVSNEVKSQKCWQTLTHRMDQSLCNRFLKDVRTRI